LSKFSVKRTFTFFFEGGGEHWEGQVNNQVSYSSQQNQKYFHRNCSKLVLIKMDHLLMNQNDDWEVCIIFE
jgi:hypothetical protein